MPNWVADPPGRSRLIETHCQFQRPVLVTILIPTLNEEEGIGPTLDAVDRDAFKERGWELEFLIVDGDSKDRTRDEAKARGARVVIEKRRGYGRAYKTGFHEARGDVIVTGDADGTYPFDRCHEYIEHFLLHDLEFVTCDRYGDIQPGAMSPKHRLGNWVLSTTARTLFWIRLRDSQSGMWVIRRKALLKLPFDTFSDGMAFSQEIKIEAFKRKDMAAQEIPASLHPRIGEAVIESWRDGFGNLGALVRKRFSKKW